MNDKPDLSSLRMAIDSLAAGIGVVGGEAWFNARSA